MYCRRITVLHNQTIINYHIIKKVTLFITILSKEEEEDPHHHSYSYKVTCVIVVI